MHNTYYTQQQSPVPLEMASSQEDSSYVEANGKFSQTLPSLGINARQHKRAIFLGVLPIVFTGGLMPIVGYFALRYGTSEKLSIVLAPWLALMGVSSLYSLITRTWRLANANSDCRPLGVTSRWTMDFFEWNFVFNFLALTAFISAGSSTSNMTIVSLPNSIIIIYVSLELLLVRTFMAFNVKAPFRFSSIAKGEQLRPATYVIMEDIVAVDCKQGQTFRRALSNRYDASPAFQAHLRNMDVFWGMSGLGIVAVIWGLAIGLRHERKTQEIAYALGWFLPWIWSLIMGLITTQWTKRMLRREQTHLFK